MPPQADCMWQRNIQVNYSTWSTNNHAATDYEHRPPISDRVSRCDNLHSFDRHPHSPMLLSGERNTISGEFFRRMLTQCSSRKDEKLPSSLRASKRGDVESIWFPVILYRAKTSHYCYFITSYHPFLTLFCFPVLVAIIPRVQSNTEQHATTYCQENDAVSLHLSTATSGLGQKF